MNATNKGQVLFAADFSTSSNDALEYAATLARQHHSKLLIAHVEEPPMAYGEGPYYWGVPEPETSELQEMLLRIRPARSDVECKHLLLHGHPVDALLDLADRENVDCIVMSSHGRTGLTRLLMGSVAEQVVRRAACAVVVVKTRIPAAEETSAPKLSTGALP